MHLTLDRLAPGWGGGKAQAHHAVLARRCVHHRHSSGTTSSHMISGVSSDLAISSQAAGPVSLVSAPPEEGLSSFPMHTSKAVAIAMPSCGSCPTHPAPSCLGHGMEQFPWSSEELLNLSGQARSPGSELQAVGCPHRSCLCCCAEGPECRWPGGRASPALCARRGEGGLVSDLCYTSKCRCFCLKHVAMGVSVVSIKQ